jgi:hypothetical protein
MKTVKSGLIVTAFAGVLSLVLSARAPVASAASAEAAFDLEAEPLQTPPPPVDCFRGCLKCQNTCKGPDCDKFCVAQWAGCCVTEGKKPTPGMLSCGCV